MKKNTTPLSLLEALDIASLTPAEQEELLIEVNDIVYKGTMMRLVGMMDETTQDDFEKLLAADVEEDEVEAFLEERVPDSGKALEETIQELRDDILAVTGASQD